MRSLPAGEEDPGTEAASGGEKLAVFTCHERLIFFWVNAGKYTIHGSYGYRNRSLFSIYFSMLDC